MPDNEINNSGDITKTERSRMTKTEIKSKEANMAILLSFFKSNF